MEHQAPVEVVPLVLLAEDDDTLRGQIARAIGELGWQVRGARNGRELLAELDALTSHHGDCFLITDLRMPQLDGVDLLAELRLRKHRMRTIVVTAFADEETRRTVRALGAAMIFSKPFDLDDLCTALQFLCTSSDF
jgi:two-component system cell cycle response regulator CpdR